MIPQTFYHIGSFLLAFIGDDLGVFIVLTLFVIGYKNLLIFHQLEDVYAIFMAPLSSVQYKIIGATILRDILFGSLNASHV